MTWTAGEDPESRAARLAVAAIAVACAISVRLTTGYGHVAQQPMLAVLQWVAAMACAVWATWPRGSGIAMRSPGEVRLAGFAVVGAIAVIAVAARTVALDVRPALNSDESGWGVIARDILSRGGDPFGFGWYDMPALGEYLTVLSFAVAGESVASLRMPSAIAGALTAIAVAWVGVRRWGLAGGAIAGLACATTLVHVHLSRQGFVNVVDALLAVIAIVALDRGWAGARPAFVVAGLALGLSQYGYMSARALPMIVVGFLVLRVFTEGRRALARWRDTAAMLFVAAVTSWPQIATAWRMPDRWMAPIARQAQYPPLDDGAAALAWILGRVRDTVLGLAVLDLRGPFAPPYPLLAPVVAALFVAGVAALAIRWRAPWSQLIALWIGAGVATVALSESMPAGHRYLLAVPAAAFLAGEGCAALLRLAGERRGLARAIAALLVAAVAAEASVRLHGYFVRTPPHLLTVRDLHNEIARDLAGRIGAAPAGARVVFFGAPRLNYHGHFQLAFLRPGTRARDVAPGEDAALAIAQGCGGDPGPPPARGEVDCLVAVAPHREGELDAIRAAVVVVRETPIVAPDGVALYRLIEACRACAGPR